MGYIDVSFEVASFGLSILLGAVFCVLYDVLRVLHKTYVKGFLEVLVTDFIYWIVVSFSTFCFLILRCKGNFRTFVIIGIALGFFIIRVTVSKYILKVFTVVFKFLRLVFGKISAIMGTIIHRFAKIIKKIANVIKKCLKDKPKLLYNQLNMRKKINSED